MSEKIPTVICLNDSSQMLGMYEDIGTSLSLDIPPIKFKGFRSEKDLLAYLDECAPEDIPTSYLLDVMPGGPKAALAILKRTDRRPPGKNPLICFSSGSMDLAIDACRKVIESRPDARVNITRMLHGEECLSFFFDLLDKKYPSGGYPVFNGLREILNTEVGTDFPMDIRPAPIGKALEIIQKSAGQSNIAALIEYHTHRLLNDSDFLVQARNAVTNMAHKAKNLSPAGKSAPELPVTAYLENGQELEFIGSEGMTSTGGPIALSVDDLGEIQGGKAVMILNRWPSYGELYPYFNKLAGVVTLSPHLADHTKMSMALNDLKGLFGLKGYPEQDPENSPVFLSGESVEVMPGVTLNKGDFISLRSKLAEESILERSFTLIEEEKRQLDIIQHHMISFFRGNRERTPRFKTTLGLIPDTDILKPIGLFRTEQLTSLSPDQLALAAAIMRSAHTPEQQEKLKTLLYADYTRLLFAGFALHNEARIRLFDFRASEHFPDGLKEGIPSDRGGDALRAFPDLYRAQARALLEAFVNVRVSSTKLEIMMPDVNTADDVHLFLSIVEQEAVTLGLERSKDYTAGVMVETLDCCRNIAEIAPLCDFLSIGSNDLTAEALEIGRGNMTERQRYKARMGYDPFIYPDPEVFEELIPSTIRKAWNSGFNGPIDLCGDHAADEVTISQLQDTGISAFSVPPTDYNRFLLPLLACYRIADRINLFAANWNTRSFSAPGEYY
jgi:hypothetical protein